MCLEGPNRKIIAQNFKSADELKQILKESYSSGDREEKVMVLKILESVDNYLK